MQALLCYRTWRKKKNPANSPQELPSELEACLHTAARKKKILNRAELYNLSEPGSPQRAGNLFRNLHLSNVIDRRARDFEATTFLCKSQLPTPPRGGRQTLASRISLCKAWGFQEKRKKYFHIISVFEFNFSRKTLEEENLEPPWAPRGGQNTHTCSCP